MRYPLVNNIIGSKREASYPLSVDKQPVDDAASRPLASSDHYHLWFFQQGAHEPGETKYTKVIPAGTGGVSKMSGHSGQLTGDSRVLFSIDWSSFQRHH